MRYAEIILTEVVRPNVLYHSTRLESLYDILDSDEIKANTSHRIEVSRHVSIRPRDVDSRGYIEGVSLTRNIRFARRWRSRWSADAGGIVLVLDAGKLRQRYRMIPLAYWTTNGARWIDDAARANGDESEEFLIGAIKPVIPLLIEIQVPKSVIDSDSLVADLPSLFPVRITIY
jgi:hypothetical protein